MHVTCAISGIAATKKHFNCQKADEKSLNKKKIVTAGYSNVNMSKARHMENSITLYMQPDYVARYMKYEQNNCLGKTLENGAEYRGKFRTDEVDFNNKI